ncbi:MAG: glycosyltransferase [Candidatus Marsarchaeota archaeon]|nr:glycosyltransferase [Candidatus Marsarchaeota archaeon]
MAQNNRPYSDCTLILPTLNEGVTIGRIIRFIFRNYPGISVIVVDDGSTDSTREEVKALASRHRELLFIDRNADGRAAGLTGSMIDGMLASDTKFVIFMDADLQHPPGKIKDIIKSLRAGYDLAAGYREEVRGWPLYRMLISKVMINMGYLALRIRRRQTCKDIFSGFFGAKRSVLYGMYKKENSRFVVSGYKYLFDILKCVQPGSLKISNIPYIFEGRKYGKSKASAKQVLALIRSFVT